MRAADRRFSATRTLTDYMLSEPYHWSSSNAITGTEKKPADAERAPRACVRNSNSYLEETALGVAEEGELVDRAQ